jgi:apolipoprotein N-acyltransferase
MHLVMFGEYIPLGPVLQFLADAFQVGSIQAGKNVKCFEVAGTKVAPNICFESMLPELVSWQIRKLSAENRAPDVLINVTNDSWFWGSSILDHHLACSIFCAVENRRPLLVAANTGLSAEVDGSGRVLQVSQRLAKASLLAQPHADARHGLVQAVGYPFAWLCCLIVSAALISSVLQGIRPRPIP